jgi:hypothetical protein
VWVDCLEGVELLPLPAAGHFARYHGRPGIRGDALVDDALHILGLHANALPDATACVPQSHYTAFFPDTLSTLLSEMRTLVDRRV